jgi:acetylornithine deacetylase/succinyl-diaminopimelate desuccinylase-like protein
MDGLDELVDPPTESELRAADAMPFDEEAKKSIYGVKSWQRGLSGREVLYEEMFAPTANIAGFLSGYTGEGSKTIVPAKAMVKMDFRLVPRQTPEKMLELLRAHLAKRGYEDIEVEQLGGLQPARISVDHPLVQTSADVSHDLGEQQVSIAPTTGGSGPLSLIATQLGIPTVMTGGPGFAGSSIHSPNECIRLDDFKYAVRYWGRFFARLTS